jgi:hypothetical protein
VSNQGIGFKFRVVRRGRDPTLPNKRQPINRQESRLPATPLCTCMSRSLSIFLLWHSTNVQTGVTTGVVEEGEMVVSPATI